MNIIAIANVKGGVGKTATATALAAFVAKSHPTLLVDTDPQAHCAKAFGLDASQFEPTIYEVLFQRALAADAIRQVNDGLSLLPCNRGLAMGEVELRDEYKREERLAEALATVAPDYEYAVIDCPPSLGLLTVNAFLASHVVIVPISSMLAYETKDFLFISLKRIKAVFQNAGWDVRILQTFYRAGVRESEALSEKLVEDFGANFFSTRINLNTDISVAMGTGRPITEFATSSGYTDYRKLSKEVLNVFEEGRD